MNDTPNRNRIAFVTCASRDIGKATAGALAKDGFIVHADGVGVRRAICLRSWLRDRMVDRFMMRMPGWSIPVNAPQTKQRRT